MFVVELKLRIQMVIMPITQHNLVVITQRASIAIIAERITTSPIIAAGFEHQNVDIVRNLDMRVPMSAQLWIAHSHQ